MRHGHTTFRYAALLSFAVSAFSLFILSSFAGTKTIFESGGTIEPGWSDVNKINKERQQIMKKYEQKPLRYDMSALEPHMQKCTLEFHYGKHHAAYIANLNAALEKTPEFEAPECPARLVHHLHHVPEAIRTAVRNNGGGHFNHSFFWKCLTPNGQGAPLGELAKAIDRDFGSFDAFREKFEATAMSHFGSGWAWLILKKDGKLAVCSTPNQDCPLMPESVVPGIERGRPILALDLWEHSFYLQYQNRKADYIKSFWKLVDWEQAEKVYQKALAHRLAKAEGKKDGCCCSQEKQGCMI